MPGPWSSYVAIGDSFTEGMDDPYGDGTYRGWADLVAGCLASEADNFRYANLAVRGRLLPAVVDAQVPLAAAMKPCLVTFSAGGNDALRRRFDPERMAEVFEGAVDRLVSSGAEVVLFTPPDVTVNYPAASRYLGPRIALCTELVRRVAKEYDTHLADLNADDGFRDRRMWSIDRLHLNPAGHRRVAHHVLSALDVECDAEWMESLPMATPARWVTARRADLQWARAHLAPWIGRRLTGRSSGDTITAKRPDLALLADHHSPAAPPVLSRQHREAAGPG
ncbi:SGNH/GDSL hydrolase family protein [Cryptosporangium sp. NPDC048952]|uniref:SGNH/GDSL hydrolase family protein n=1 Tax=Cryptosporangium sp. NPDC048952 TaxID=3363961 RepID=UPI003712D4C1